MVIRVRGETGERCIKDKIVNRKTRDIFDSTRTKGEILEILCSGGVLFSWERGCRARSPLMRSNKFFLKRLFRAAFRKRAPRILAPAITLNYDVAVRE